MDFPLELIFQEFSTKEFKKRNSIKHFRAKETPNETKQKQVGKQKKYSRLN